MPNYKIKDHIAETAENCIDCGKCEKHCLFLQRHGSPGSLAREILESEISAQAAAIFSFECSLCSLCTAVCPVDCNPSAMFGELRNKAVKLNLTDLEVYSPILKYEDLGRSRLLSGGNIPRGCKTAFFPGCTLPGMFPHTTMQTYKTLLNSDNKIGIILDCCSKPSISLGISQNIESRLFILVGEIARAGISEILTACPNCYTTLKAANPPFEVNTVYSYLNRSKTEFHNHEGLHVTIHDPCVTRFENEMHEDIRSLLDKCKIKYSEPLHSKEKTFCCGEGGATSFLDESIAGEWKNKRGNELLETGLPAISYCAGCVNYLSSKTQITHLLNILFNEKPFQKPKTFPFNYFSRFFFKLKTKALKTRKSR
jgi:Fe-S oxidoreductase